MKQSQILDQISKNPKIAISLNNVFFLNSQNPKDLQIAEHLLKNYSSNHELLEKAILMGILKDTHNEQNDSQVENADGDYFDNFAHNFVEYSDDFGTSNSIGSWIKDKYKKTAKTLDTFKNNAVKNTTRAIKNAGKNISKTATTLYRGVKSGLAFAPRQAALALIGFNFTGFATKWKNTEVRANKGDEKAKKELAKFYNVWVNDLGGNKNALVGTLNSGSKRKSIFSNVKKEYADACMISNIDSFDYPIELVYEDGKPYKGGSSYAVDPATMTALITTGGTVLASLIGYLAGGSKADIKQPTPEELKNGGLGDLPPMTDATTGDNPESLSTSMTTQSIDNIASSTPFYKNPYVLGGVGLLVVGVVTYIIIKSRGK